MVILSLIYLFGAFCIFYFLECSDSEMLCSESNICIPISSRCDGNPECPNNEDEIGCGTGDTYYPARGVSQRK